MSSTPSAAPQITDHEAEQVERANASDLPIVAFVQRLWLLPSKIVEIPGRGHALTIDSGWQEVAQKALDFVRRFS